jgi:hypothetical protein
MLSTDSKWNIDATFNGNPASDCSSTDKKDNSNDKTNDKSNDKPNSSSSPQGHTRLTWPPQVVGLGSSFVSDNSVAQQQGSSNQGGTTGSQSPGGELHFCKESKNKLTMKADKPLVFAMGAYEVVQKIPNGLLLLEPVMSVPKNSGPFNEMMNEPGQEGPVGVEMTKPNVPVAGSAKPHWERQSWPANAKP